MPQVRLSRAAGLTTTETGVLLRSDLGAFALEGRDVQQFVSALAPLLAGWREPDALAAALPGYSPAGVLRFLALLQQRGLLETRDAEESAEAPDERLSNERWRGQEEFFRRWPDPPGGAPAWNHMERLRAARILVAGLEPWGVVAATELAASGVGALHLLDGGVVTPDDLLSVRLWDRSHLGRPRADALRDVLARQAPWCAATSGPLELDPAGLLRTSGDETPADEQKLSLLLAATGGDDLRVLHAAARRAHSLGLPSLYGALEGLEARIGPAVVPGRTACWNCCRLRLLANADPPESAHELQAALLAASPLPRLRTYLAPTAALLGHTLALEAIALVTEYTRSTLTGCLRTQNLVTGETERRPIIRMPWCDVCGGAASSGDPVSSPVDSLGDARSPEELRGRLAGWVDARTGIVRSLLLRPLPSDDPGLPHIAVAIPARYTEGRPDPQTPAISSGHGLSAVRALLGAAGEAVERYSASRFRLADMRRARLADLPGPALDPRLLCLYSDDQYDAPGFPFARFSPDRPIAWTEARWLDSGEPVWVPALPTYLNFPAPLEENFCQVSSNGLAAGSGLEDAARRAVFELVERDAFLLTWLARRPGRRIVLDGTTEPGVLETVRQLEGRSSARVELYLLDVGLSLPTVVCIAFGDGRDWPGATLALAAHSSPRVALRKAVLEHGSVGTSIRRAMVEGSYPIPARPEDVHTLEDHALYYAPPDRARAFDFLRGGSAPAPLESLVEPEAFSLDDCAQKLSQAGIRVAIADVTSPDVALGPFRVARALGTHMQPIDFGHRLRRLGNPRLQALLTDGPNPDPHPLA